jgi:biopolymer transport protein ExbD
MGSSVDLEIHSSGSLTINGDDDFKGRPWTAILRELFSTRESKTLLISPDGDVRMSQVLAVLEQLNEHPFVKTILMTGVCV